MSEALQGVELHGIRSGTRVTRIVLANAAELIAVGTLCIGTNHVDLAASADEGIAVLTRRSPTPEAWSSWISPG